MTKSQQNLSPSNAFTRFMLGSILTAYGTVKLLREPNSRGGKMLVLFGSMKVAEGATKFCPTKAISKMMDSMMSETTSQSTSTGADTSMYTGTSPKQYAANGNSNQMSGNIMQMVGNIAQKLSGANATQSASSGTQSKQVLETQAQGLDKPLRVVASLRQSGI